MTDNVGIVTGTDADVATDDVGGVHYQKVKLVLGAADSATQIEPGRTGEANSVPVAQALDSESVSEIIKTVSATGTPEAVAGSETLFRRATIMGKSAARTLNSDNVYLGWSSSDGEQAYEVAPGTVHAIAAPEGQQFDLASLYVDVETADDGVIVWYS